MPKIYATPTPDVTPQERAHAELARRLAGDCVVLLKNDGSLPLSPKLVALYGTGARKTVKGGTGSGDVYTRTNITVEQGLQQGGFTIASSAWLDRFDAKYTAAYDAYTRFLEETARAKNTSPIAIQLDHPFDKVAPVPVTDEDIAASGTDTAIYVISRDSGEGKDRRAVRGDYLLFEEELQNLRAIAKGYAHVIVVLNVGAVTDLSELNEIENIGALLLMGQLGNIGGQALCDVLTGHVAPSGKLADTWARRYEDYPSSATFSSNDGNVDDEPYAEGIYVGYRWFDSFGVEPVYPFGYGLSYTTFDIETKAVCVSPNGQHVLLTAEVTNTGDRFAGREVVQLYASAPDGELDKPERVLAAYAKTCAILPGETETVTLSFCLRDIASYSEARAAYILEAGRYLLRVGASSRDAKAVAALTLPRTVVTAQLTRLSSIAPAQPDAVPPTRPADDASARFELTLDPNAFETLTPVPVQRETMVCDRADRLTMADVLSGRASVEELTAQLTVPEMADLCVGTLRADGLGVVVGNASCTVPGAAGDTTARLEESRGIRPLILADGPAGLRLTPHFAIAPDGTIKPDASLAAPEDKHYYQYCTAIPIGWSLAQSWDSALLETVGSMVGEEMERFGVDLWLAPALNIHRNPLCGRNFEYYSEDPLLSGRTAAAISRGVQRHPGCGVTIKHYACNSQEDNRYFSNSILSERALREIYLKGFEIAVRESQPLSVMTSYNLVCGTHAANHRELLETVLRGEWGYTGFVMTDWFTSQDARAFTGTSDKYPISSSAGCVYAGNDVQMPGCQQNVDDIVRAVETGEAVDGYRVTLADLQFCAANVLRVIARMGI